MTRARGGGEKTWLAVFCSTGLPGHACLHARIRLDPWLSRRTRLSAPVGTRGWRPPPSSRNPPSASLVAWGCGDLARAKKKNSRACSGGNVWEIRGPKMGIVQKYPSSARATPPPTTKLAAADAPSITTPAPANQPYQTGDPGLFPICPPNLQYDFFSSMGGRRQQAGRVRSNSPS